MGQVKSIQYQELPIPPQKWPIPGTNNKWTFAPVDVLIHQCIDIKMLSEKLNMSHVLPPKSIRYQELPIPPQKWPISGTNNKWTVDIKMLAEKLNMGQVLPPTTVSKSIQYQELPLPPQKWPIPSSRPYRLNPKPHTKHPEP